MTSTAGSWQRWLASRERPLLLILIPLILAALLMPMGCTLNPYPPAVSAPTQGNPWTNAPGAVTPTLPPPAGYPGTTAPPAGQPGGTLPSVPSLPPASSGGSGTTTTPPGGSGGFSTPPANQSSNATPGGTALPNFGNPGTMQQQQQRATQFDPYADNDAAPEIVGGRPREFQKPLAEPVRARGFRDTRWPF